MENPEKGRISLIKKSLLYLVFIIELIFLFRISFDFVESEKYFSLSKSFAIPYVLILIFSLLTVSLISQTLEKKWEILVCPALIFFSSLIFLARYKIGEALLTSIMVSTYFLLQQQKTKSLKDNFLKISIKKTSKYITKGLLLVISATISMAVFLNSKNVQTLDVGKIAADIAGKPIEDAIKKESEKKIPEDINAISLESIQQSNPQFFSVLNSFGVDKLPIKITNPQNISNNLSDSFTETVKKSISNQVNKTIEPYKKFFKPALALLVFGILQMYHTIVYLVFSTFSNLFLLILRKTKFIQIKKIPAEKEIIEF